MGRAIRIVGSVQNALRIPLIINLIAGLGVALVPASAALHYVDLNNASPEAPYASWATAATNLQDAIDAASNGDEVVVTNGVYDSGGRTARNSQGASLLPNRAAVTAAITVRSVNGPGVTIIQGVPAFGTTRCVYLTNGAALSGFTLTNGGTLGVGAPNILDRDGGGVLGEGSSSTTVSNCVLVGNSAYDRGGGAFAVKMFNCLLSSNTAAGSSGSGGGAAGCTLANCVLAGNFAKTLGGGANSCDLYHCTVVYNGAGTDAGGVFRSGSATFTVANSIVYYNSSPGGMNFNADFIGSFSYCCTTPMPDSILRHVGVITNEPALVDAAGGDFHLQAGSPCINSGNNAFVASATDLDGVPRIAAGTTDLGAEEFQNPASTLSYAWAQQYGVPLDGSADFADPDGDGMNNWQESIAGTDPTNAASVLCVLTLTNNAPGLKVTWQSVTNRNYFVQRSTNLAISGFVVRQTNLVGRAGSTTFQDTTATNGNAWFYRVGVQ